MGIKEGMAQGRCAWRNITEGTTLASTDVRHIDRFFPGKN